MLVEVLVEAGGDELLHAQLNLSLLSVDSEHLRLNRLAGPQDVLRMVDALVGADFADVDQPLNAFGDLHEGAELGNTDHRALDGRTDGKLVRNFEPWVAERLLESERESPFRGTDGENDRVDGVALFQNVAGLVDLLDPRHLRDVDEAFNTGFEFDEGAEVGEA